VLVTGDLFVLELLAVKVAAQHEDAIFLDLVPVKAEESLLRLEIADLQDAVDLGLEAGAACGECQLGFGHGQIFKLLAVVKVG